MSKNEKSGPAFPRGVIERDYLAADAGKPRELRVTSVGYDTDGGMSLRDYFAAKAMQSLLVDSEIVADGAPETHEQLARDAYAVADAMLSARRQ